MLETLEPSVLCYRGNDTQNFESRLTDEDLSILCTLLQDVAFNIEHIDLSYNKINDLSSLVSLLASCENLRSLNLQVITVKQTKIQNSNLKYFQIIYQIQYNNFLRVMI